MHTFKGKGGFLVKRILKRWEKVLTGALIGIFLLAGGFMGVDKFMTKERSLTIFDEASVVSGNAPADESASSDKEVKNSDLKIEMCIRDRYRKDNIGGQGYCRCN